MPLRQPTSLRFFSFVLRYQAPFTKPDPSLWELPTPRRQLAALAGKAAGKTRTRAARETAARSKRRGELVFG